MRTQSLLACLATICTLTFTLPSASAEPSHALAMHGEPALGASYSHIPYANPDAPKGGRMIVGFLGSFDSMNPYILSGTAPRGMNDSVFGDNVYERLMFRSRNEPFTLYSFIAETVEVPEDRSWIEFHLNPDAAFSDGEQITVDDIIGTIELLKERGRPNYRTFYNTIAQTERVGDRGVRFTFDEDSDREAPLLLGLMPVLPATRLDPEAFEKSSLDLIPGSGPYIVTEVDPGNRIVMRRNEAYWAKDHPAKRGFDNFDEIVIDYYRDETALFEALKKGLVDVMVEGDPQRWATGYDFPAAERGDVVQQTFEPGTPAGMYGFVFNTRRAMFEDPEVREAIASLLDFEWINRNLYFDLFNRTSSYFERSSLASTGRPANDTEREILSDYLDELRSDVLDGTYRPIETDGSGRDRAVLRAAVDTLRSRGWTVDNGVLIGPQGEPMTFDVLVRSASEERLALAFQSMLAPIGITANVRLTDSSQYFERLKSFDYDMTLNTWFASLSPGREQLFRWSTESADQDGTFNYAGVKSGAADAAIEAMLQALDRETFEDAVRALDRALISGSYVVPLFHQPAQWVSTSGKIKVPETTSLYGFRPDTWWSSEAE